MKKAALFLLLFVGVASAQHYQVIHYFAGTANGDGSDPQTGLITDAMGNFYGTTELGGSANAGTVYELQPPAPPGNAWTEAVLYSFTGNGGNGDGYYPFSELVTDQLGNLYGTTIYGGSGPCTFLGAMVGCGTVFELSPPSHPGGAWTETVLYSFQDAGDGCIPETTLVFDQAGNLYGANSGSAGVDAQWRGPGVVFELSPPLTGGVWTETTIHQFGASGDGEDPAGNIVFDKQGNVYGTTLEGGYLVYGCYNGCGVVYELTPPSSGGAWTETILHQFDARTDGGAPAGLVPAPSGAFAGPEGPTIVGGAIFAITPPQQPGGRWGFGEIAGPGGLPNDLTFRDGHEGYGTTVGGIGSGNIFRLNPPSPGGRWTETLLYTFENSSGGISPTGVIVYNNALYGTATGGGYNNNGVVFRLEP